MKCSNPWNHHLVKIQDASIPPKVSSCSFVPFSNPMSPDHQSSAVCHSFCHSFYLINFLRLESYDMYSFWSGFSHSASFIVRCIYVVWYVRSSFLFYLWVGFYYMDVPQFVFLFTYWWTFGSFSGFGDYKLSCCEPFIFVWLLTSFYPHLNPVRYMDTQIPFLLMKKWTLREVK